MPNFTEEPWQTPQNLGNAAVMQSPEMGTTRTADHPGIATRVRRFGERSRSGNAPLLRKSQAALSLPPSPKQNHLLAALPDKDFARLLPDLELISMPRGWVVYGSGSDMGYLYFPTTSIASRLYVMESGASAEIEITGNEGVVGLALILGGEGMPGRLVVQTAGYGYRVKANVLKREFELSCQLQHLVLPYTLALITQLAQTAVCNRHHPLNQQLCRYLLMTLDRSPGNHLRMTQEVIANMLGVRRESVTYAAIKLQADGLIHYRRGHITVLDRQKLEERACECYATMKKEYDRLLPHELLAARPGTTASAGCAAPILSSTH
jgi:CRP-like cAMP-binding protein